MRFPAIFGLFARPPIWLSISLASLPFLVMIILYLVASDIRHEANPNDKLLPSLGQIVDTMDRLATTEDKRTGDILLWTDTAASLGRLFGALAISASLALLVGLNMGAFPGLFAVGSPFLTFVSMIPPLALLPILFISFGIGEAGKVILIVIGTFPVLCRDMALSIRSISTEIVVKAKTLGASDAGVVYRIFLPQLVPRLLTSLRLVMGAAWLFLIAAEAIAAENGLGYRIFLVRRYMAMDVIISYVAWITLLGFTTDWILKTLTTKFYPWFSGGKV